MKFELLVTISCCPKIWCKDLLLHVQENRLVRLLLGDSIWQKTLKLAADDSQDICEMRKTGEMREKKEHARDNVNVIYRRFMIRLFSRTIILSLSAQENLFVSCIITASTSRWFEIREICLDKAV